MNPTQIYRDFGGRVSTRRKALGLTQAELSTRLGISRASLANIERGGQKVLLHQVFALAGALGMAPVELMPTPVLASQSNVQMPADLNETQRAQILSLISDPRAKAPAKEDVHASSTAVRPKAKRSRVG